VIYECTISGEEAIIWSGSAFECTATDKAIILFNDVQGTAECNDGLKAKRNNYTAQLFVANSSLSGSNVSCTVDKGTNSEVIDNLSIPNMTHSGRCS
jgi:hypothetical protein